MGTYMHFDPDNARSYVGFNLPADQLAALDQARLESRLSRSQLMRQALAAYLQQRQVAGD
jgi:metal-responsive CopG/Arc/MetJ family transcriptional regulator